jgi:glucokinase
MILAGDIGGTKTHLALFDRDLSESAALEVYPSREQTGLEEMLAAFFSEHPADVESACFGVAGPVRDGRVETTNLAWGVDAWGLARELGLESVGLLNDLEANAYGIAALVPADFAVLQQGDPRATGNAAVCSAGTGLGEAGLYWNGEQHRPFACEGGHTDFAPRSDLEVELWRFLAAEFGHVSYERVCSGMGLVNVYRFLVAVNGAAPAVDLDAAMISQAALDRSDDTCVRALDLMVSIYGAEAGNLALKIMAAGGVYLGGGIAPKILPKLSDGTFVRAFADKGRFSSLLEDIPVRVILSEKAALLGAARYAAAALDGPSSFSSHHLTLARSE